MCIGALSHYAALAYVLGHLSEDLCSVDVGTFLTTLRTFVHLSQGPQLLFARQGEELIPLTYNHDEIVQGTRGIRSTLSHVCFVYAIDTIRQVLPYCVRFLDQRSIVLKECNE